ncbi:MAG: hypothetical protein QUV06_01545 [Cyanobium sp. CZS 48M]|nr:hypothetical protein [Cyanobium sp. CZS48M]
MAGLVAIAQPLCAAPAKLAMAARVELLFVQNSAGVEIDVIRGLLTWRNVAPSTLFFTDRPARMAGHCHTKEEFLKLWFEGPDSFSRNPPNATLSILEPGKPDLLNVVVQLRNPRLNGNDLLYDIKLVEGVLPASGDAAVLFIDVLGFWRRNVRRVAIVGTSTAIAASAAVSASEAIPPAATMVPASQPCPEDQPAQGDVAGGPDHPGPIPESLPGVAEPVRSVICQTPVDHRLTPERVTEAPHWSPSFWA